jgi:hypothetical protein
VGSKLRANSHPPAEETHMPLRTINLLCCFATIFLLGAGRIACSRL